MRRIGILLATAAALLATNVARADDELPACNSDQVKQTLINVVRPDFITEQTDFEHTDQDASKRWCYAYFASPYSNGRYYMGAPFQEAVFTIEWTNKSEHRFWLQVTQQHEYRKYGDERDYPENLRAMRRQAQENANQRLK